MCCMTYTLTSLYTDIVLFFFSFFSKTSASWSWNKSADRIIVGYVGALYTSIVLGNHPVSVKLTQNLFFESIHQGVTKRKLVDGLRDLGLTVSQAEDQSSRVCSPRSNQVRSTQAGFCFIKASFQEGEHNNDSFRSLKNRMSTSHDQTSESIPSEYSSQTNQTEMVHSIWLSKKNSKIFGVNGKHPGSPPPLYEFHNSKAPEPPPANQQYLTSQIRSDNPGLQSRSHRRGVTPLVLFWNFSGYIS